MPEPSARGRPNAASTKATLRPTISSVCWWVHALCGSPA